MIELKLSSLKETSVREYAVRFLFGGFCTAAAGLIAKRFGAGVGGLFLAFPAIFPAGASLIENHEKKRKAEIGADGSKRGRMAASIDSAGAARGCIALLSFAIILWGELPIFNAYIVVSAATTIWLVVAVTLWKFRRFRLVSCSDRP